MPTPSLRPYSHKPHLRSLTHGTLLASEPSFVLNIFFSRTPHHTAYLQASSPTMPSQFIAQQQLKFPPSLLEHDMENPAYAVLFTSSQAPRLNTVHRRRGRPRQRYLPQLLQLATKTLNLLPCHLTSQFPDPFPCDLYHIKVVTSSKHLWDSVIAAPTRSLFATDFVALRSVVECETTASAG